MISAGFAMSRITPLTNTFKMPFVGSLSFPACALVKVNVPSVEKSACATFLTVSSSV